MRRSRVIHLRGAKRSRRAADAEESREPENPPDYVKGITVNSPTSTLTGRHAQQADSHGLTAPGTKPDRNEQDRKDKLRLRNRLVEGEAGMATAEYAIATLAAVGLAGLLVVLLRSDEVRGFLLNLIRTALSLP
ncbi:DUF4244 domain-containing protein [Paenarthrobacter sp. NPDC058040]|uniref:DUF4244 domain-containing protein n=1 Tax=unclassified Paenarthrobacter TaxID=2634190 RepID=UPI0036DBD6DB